MPERRLRLARQEASDCSWKGMSPCFWLAAVCLPLKVMPSKTTFLYPNTNSRLSHGNWYIDNKMKCLSRLEKELPPLLLPLMQGWQLWNVFPRQGMWQCSVASRWEGGKGCTLRNSVFVTARIHQPCAALSGTGWDIRLLHLFLLQYFSNTEVVRSREKQKS